MASIGNITASADGSQSPTQAPASGLFATLKNMAASVAPSLVSPTCDDAAAAAAAKSSPGTEQAAARMEGEGGGSKASAPAAGGADGAAEGGGILAAATEKLSTVIEAVAPGWVTGAPGADDDGEQPSSQQKPKSASSSSKEQAAKPKAAAAEDAAPIGGNGTMLERASEVASTIGATAAAKLSGAVEAVETAVAGTTQAVKAALPEAIVGAPTPEDEAAAKAAKKKAKKQRQRERKAAAGEAGKEEEEEADSGDSSDASSSEEDDGKERHGHPLKATKVGGRRMALRKQLSGENLPLAEMQAEKAAAAQQAVVFDQIHGASHSRAHQHGIVNDSKRLPAQYAPKHAQLPPPKHNTVARSDFAQRGTTHQTGAQMRSAAGNAH